MGDLGQPKAAVVLFFRQPSIDSKQKEPHPAGTQTTATAWYGAGRNWTLLAKSIEVLGAE